MKEFLTFKKNKYILLLIIFFAAVLRLLFYTEIPYTHDEFSALFRTQFDNFSDLINKGIIIDGHPAGIQVFLYYWTIIFGYSEIVVKIPFIVSGVFSVLLIYILAKDWYNETVGLICAAYIATLQYTIMYSQIARPYITGLFFVLLMVYFWSKVVFNPQKKIVNYVLFIVTASLCAYNHHFSLLFAIIVGFTGLFFIPKKYLLKYIISDVAIFILYIPHLRIFFYQLNLEGVESWLAKPKNDFLFNYIGYIFHFSAYSIVLLIAITLFGMYKMKKSDFKNKYFVISIIWFFLPFLIGFFYSKYVNAILQYSVLIFSFPFLLFSLFGHIPNIKTKFNSAIVFLILLVNTLTLIFERKHYEVFYMSHYEQILIEHDKLKSQKTDFVSIIDSNEKISDYYIKKNSIDTSFIWYSSFNSKKEFISFLDTKSKNHSYLYFGCFSATDPILIPIIKDYFPYVKWQKNYSGATLYLFSTNIQDNNQKHIYSSICNFDKEHFNYWETGDKKLLIDSISFSGDYSFLIDSSQVWGPTFSCELKKLMNNKNNFIDVSLKTLPLEQTIDALLVTSLESDDKVIDWRATNFNTFFVDDKNNNEWVNIHHSIKLSDIYLNYKNLKIKVYVWNENKRNFLIDDFAVKTREGNPIIYGINERF